ncbi:hypothetical protein SAMN04487948_103341 [Halogranum amylolyticum]|uniref:Phospholipase_D-nuclease N-terminal n=1 Tax=Halogranum amylolyticum TaxID=660520 RepID=A0A1H8QW54_9EURY|nr:hypothetical protein [Halogranum amylolyticum]SEO58286.1 hypothetical protein SAMN04487948_103341 [Halogranum amylolyticum]
MSVILQFGVPGAVELAVLLVLFVVPLAVAYWVYRDASRHGVSYAPAWALGILALLFAGLLPGLLALAAYLYVRENSSERPDRPTV